jgi:hypothetical protein
VKTLKKIHIVNNPIEKFFGNIFIIFGLIPWVNFGLNNNDSQPWTFIFSIIYLGIISRTVRLPKYSISILILTIIGLFITIYLSNISNTQIILRAIIGYLSLPLLYIGFYNYFIRHGIPIKLFIILNILWVVFGFIEFFLPEFGNLITNSRTNISRGVTSLAPEPSFFATYLFISSWILIEAENFKIKKKEFFILLVNILCIIFLAKSAIGTIFLFLGLLSFLTVKFIYFFHNLIISKKKTIIYTASIFIICVMSLFLKDLLSGSRLFSIISNFSTNKSILSLVITDWSVNSRVESIYFSIMGSLKNYFFPGGLDTFREMRQHIYETMPSGIFFNRYPGMKIMSWNGSIFYELGIMGIIIVILFFKAIYRSFKGSFFYFMFLFIILFSPIPIGFSMIPLLFSLMVYNKKYNI